MPHELEDIRILSVSSDGYGGLKRVICDERGYSEGSGIALGQEGYTSCCSWTFLPVNWSAFYIERWDHTSEQFGSSLEKLRHLSGARAGSRGSLLLLKDGCASQAEG